MLPELLYIEFLQALVRAPVKDKVLLESHEENLGIVCVGGFEKTIGIRTKHHVAVKFGKAFGLHVTIISTSSSKQKDFISRTDAEQIQSKRRSLDFILDTVSVDHSVETILELLKVNGTLIIVGKREAKGSLIGSIKETQEMMDLCGKHNITCDIELVRTVHINNALLRLAKNDLKYRFVIDIANISSKL